MVHPPQGGFVPNYNALGRDWGTGGFREAATSHRWESTTGLFWWFSVRAGFEERELGRSWRFQPNHFILCSVYGYFAYIDVCAALPRLVPGNARRKHQIPCNCRYSLGWNLSPLVQQPVSWLSSLTLQFSITACYFIRQYAIILIKSSTERESACL